MQGLKLILPTDFVTAGQDAVSMVPFLAHFIGVMDTQSSKLADCSISYPNVQNIRCRCCRYQSTSTLCLSGRMPLTWVRRRLQRIAPGFPNPYINIRHWLFLEGTLWLQKERNGRSTERLPLPHFQRYVQSANRRLILNTLFRKIIN